MKSKSIFDGFPMNPKLSNELAKIAKEEMEKQETPIEKQYPKGLMGAVQKLKEEGTEEEYEALIRSMFEKLDRKGKRKVINQDLKFSSQAKKLLFKKK